MYFAVSLLIKRQMFLHAEKTLLNADFNTDAARKFGVYAGYLRVIAPFG
jgi:hypothetical protein